MTEKQSNMLEAVFIGCSLFEGSHEGYHADTVAKPTESDDEFEVKVEMTGPGFMKVIHFSELDIEPKTVAAVLDAALRNSRERDWHLSPSQIEQLEDKIKAYAKASNGSNMATDEEEIFENVVLGNLDTLIGDINVQ